MENDDEYWITGVKQRGSNRHPQGGRGVIQVDSRCVDELLSLEGWSKLDRNYEVIEIQDTDPQDFVQAENSYQFKQLLRKKSKKSLTAEEWTESIRQIVIELAEKNRQADEWFGKGETDSSPSNLFCTLLDDNEFTEFREHDEIVLTKTQPSAGQKLLNAMNAYKGILDPERVFHDPEWDKIRGIAQEFLNTF